MTAIHPLRVPTQTSAFKSVQLALKMQTVTMQLNAHSVQDKVTHHTASDCNESSGDFHVTAATYFDDAIE